MTIVLNEARQAEQIIREGEIGNKPASTLFLLGKYYRLKENLDQEQTFCKLHEFMQMHYKNYNPALWEEILDDISKKAGRYPLREINFIGIAQSELDKISEIPNLKYQKLLFSMLCYAKLYNLISEKNNGWVNASVQEIFRTSRVTVKYKKDKFLYMNDLEKAGFLSFSSKNDNLNIQINFVDMDGESVLRIDDFRELGYEYMNFIGNGKYRKCPECQRLIRKTGNKSLYCTECRQKKQKEWQRNSMQKIRKQSGEVLEKS